MKVVTRYVCEICEKVFNTEEDCKNCEDSHKWPFEITECKYAKGTLLPHSITAIFEGIDGTFTYTR